jgi:hypothetical protein
MSETNINNKSKFDLTCEEYLSRFLTGTLNKTIDEQN